VWGERVLPNLSSTGEILDMALEKLEAGGFTALSSGSRTTRPKPLDRFVMHVQIKYDGILQSDIPTS
jgi:hypothetical protein